MKLYKNVLVLLVMTLVIIVGCNQKKPLYIEITLSEELKDVIKGEKATIGVIKNVDGGADYLNNMMSNNMMSIASVIDSVDVVDGKINFTLSGNEIKDVIEMYYISIINKDSKYLLVSTFAKAGDNIKVTFENGKAKIKGSSAENYLNSVDSINKSDTFISLRTIKDELIELIISDDGDFISQEEFSSKGQELYNKCKSFNDSLISSKLKLLLEEKEHHVLISHELFNLLMNDFYELDLLLKSMKLDASNFHTDNNNTFREENIKSIKSLLTDEVKTHPVGNTVYNMVTYENAFKVFVSSEITRMDYKEVKEAFDALDKDGQASIFGVKVQKKLKPLQKVSIGSIAPDIITKKIDGSDFKLSEVKNKLILLDFWASWCMPCRMENPKYIDIYNKFKDKGLEIIAYSLDTDKEKWEEAIKEDKLTWEHVGTLLNPSNDPVLEDYLINAVPSNYLLVDGKIVGVNVFGKELEKLVAEHL